VIAEPRAVTVADRAEWLRLASALHPDEATDALAVEIDTYLARARGRPPVVAVFVVDRVRDGETAGLCGFLELSVREYAEGCDGPTPYVEGWYVDDDVRRHGVGRALMAAAERWARAHGYRALASDALLDNTVSHQAHAALGFDEVEKLVVFRKALR
jgi:aminoglycoside 6'-N-acetyltransferase I